MQEKLGDDAARALVDPVNTSAQASSNDIVAAIDAGMAKRLAETKADEG